MTNGSAQQKRQVNFRGGGKTILINDIPLHSTFDGRVVGDNAPLEIKAHFGFKDMDELADFYAPQCQHHMLVAGADRCYFVALFGVQMSFRVAYDYQRRKLVRSVS